MKVTITLDGVDMCIEGQHIEAVHPSQEDPGNREYFEPEKIIALGSLLREDPSDRGVILMVEDYLLNSRDCEICQKCLEVINGCE